MCNEIVMHEVFVRENDREVKTPSFADGFESLDPEAMEALQERLTTVLAPGGKVLEMAIAQSGPESFVTLAEQLMGDADKTFLERSRNVANKLAQAQTARRIPGGMVIVFSGVAGVPGIPYIGVIKAETQAGFRRTIQGPRTVIEFLNNIFLTQSTRLYKVAMLLRSDALAETPDGWRAFIFDANMSQADREKAALYFYETFLGCAFPKDGAYETRRFFDLTKEFVKKSPLPPEQKRNIVDGLFVFVRDEQAATFTADQFSQRLLPLALRDPYAEFLQSSKLRQTAINRDLSDMGSRLKRRVYKFGGDIALSGPAKALAEDVSIREVKGEDGSVSTHVIINRPFAGER